MPDVTPVSMHDARDAFDAQLLEAGDHRGLVESYYGLMLNRCRARTRSEADAIAVAAEVAIRLLDELGRGRRYRVPFRVVVNMVITWKLKEHYRGLPAPWAELHDEASEDDALRDLVDGDYVAWLLEGLAPRELEVARLRLEEGLEPDEIAERLGIERNNVDQAWHRAKRKLRERMDEG